MQQTKKMTMIAFIAISLTGLKTKAQNTTGIRFEKDLSWEQIAEKAKAERKYIFVDCYATWCGPCKVMDRDVYARTNVGVALNNYFVSVKVQMDQQPGDDEQTKSWYKTAGMLATVYKVEGYPSFLFFDPDGKLVHKAVGDMDVPSFIQLANDARDPNKQYNEVLAHFQPNTLDTAQEKGLVNLVKTTDRTLAGKIAADYLHRIPTVQLRKNSNGQLMWEFQDNPEVAAIAVKAIENSDPKENLEFIQAIDKQPAVIQWAVNYIGSLSQERLSQVENLNLIVDFQDSPQVTSIALSLIQADLKSNFELVDNMKSQPAVIKWSENYILSHSLSDSLNKELATIFKNDPLVNKYAAQYIADLREKQLYTKENIEFTKAFTDTSAGRGYDLFFRHAAKVDTIMHNPDYAKGVINAFVTNEIISPSVKSAKKTNTEPDWTAIARAIEKKFGKTYVTDNLVYAQMRWYWDKRDGANAAKFIFLRLDKLYKDKGGVAGSHLSPADWWNQNIYQIFLYDQNQSELEKALVWMHEVNQLLKNANAGTLDTEANLLYKLGRKDQAIAMETQATRLDPKADGIAQNLKTMQANKPTWSLTGKIN